MNTLQILSMNALVIFAITTSLWLLSLRLKDTSIIDLFWGVGFVIIGWVTFGVVGFSGKGVCLVVCCTLWGLRLSLYLAWRNHGGPEDYRYAAMRSRHGKSFWWISLITIFWLQGTVMWVIALPIQIGQHGGGHMTSFGLLGVVIWLVGFYFEAVSDFQLARFKRKGNGVMDQGLWRYSRHPNYFGNALIWWGLTLIAIQPQTWWLIISPTLMTFLLLKVSGVALLERSLSKRSAEYRAYMLRTSPFFPLPPKTLQTKLDADG